MAADQQAYRAMVQAADKKYIPSLLAGYLLSWTEPGT